ncbi:hypothetical protein BSKO_10578 [Bryopsis sp. KO-2023]|nr:hypothetical protein BSKO_10578 [Bryopsis sp. KO-2023]
MPRWPEENYISLASLIRSGVLAAGGYLSVTAYGETHTAVLLHSGAIQFKGRDFASPSSFSLFVKQIYNPTKKADDGWKSVCYKGKPLEDFRKMFRVSHGHFVEGASTSKKRSKKKNGKAGKRAKKTVQDSPSRKYTPTGAIPRVVGIEPEHQIRHNNCSPFLRDIQQEKPSANFCKRVVLFGASNSSRTDSEKNSTTAVDNTNTNPSNKVSLSISNGITSSNNDMAEDPPLNWNGAKRKSLLSQGVVVLPFRGEANGAQLMERGGSSKQSDTKRRASNCSTKIKLFRRKGNCSSEKGLEGPRNDGGCSRGVGKKKDWKSANAESKSKRNKDDLDDGGQQPLFRSKNRTLEEGLGSNRNNDSEKKPVEKKFTRGVFTGASDGVEKEIGSVSITFDCSKNGGSASSLDSFNKGSHPSDIASKNRFSSSASRSNIPKRNACHSGARCGFSRSNPPGSELGTLHRRVNCMSIGDGSPGGNPSAVTNSKHMTANHLIESDVCWMANSAMREGGGGAVVPINSNSTEETTDGTRRKAGGGDGEDAYRASMFSSEGSEVADPKTGIGEKAEGKGGCAEKKSKKSCGKRKDPTFSWWRCTNCGKFRKVITSGLGPLSHQNTFVCDFNQDERYNRCLVPEEKRVEFSGRLSVQAFLEFSHRPPLDRCTANEFYYDLSIFLHKVENQKRQAKEIQDRDFEIDLFSLYKAVVRGGGLHVFCQRMDLKSFRLLKIMLATNEVFIPGGCVAAAKEFIKFLAGYERACFKRDFEFYE